MDEFQPSTACKNLDYPPGNLRFLQAGPGHNASCHTTTHSSGISLNVSYNIIHDNGLEMQGKLCFQQKGLTWTAEGCYNLINDEKRGLLNGAIPNQGPVGYPWRGARADGGGYGRGHAPVVPRTGRRLGGERDVVR